MAKQTVDAALGLLFMLNVISRGFGQFYCDPVKDCNASVAGDLVPDPHDCQQYYVCVANADGSAVAPLLPVHCGYGFYFDQTTRTCKEEETPEECNNLCQNVCPDGCTVADNSLAADKDDCSKYYFCGTNVIPLICSVAPNLYFDGTICQPDPSKCCDFCKPFCVSGRTQVVDPCDCHSYYICLGPGEPSEDNRGTCPPNYSYDEASASCVPTTCTNFCSVDKCAAFKNRGKVNWK